MGKPLTEGQIVFEPDNSGREAHGSIQPDGEFELSTFANGDGAVPGTHRVAVTSGKIGKQVVPVKYQNTSSSKTEVEVARASPSTLSTSSDFRRDRRRTYLARGSV